MILPQKRSKKPVVGIGCTWDDGTCSQKGWVWVLEWRAWPTEPPRNEDASDGFHWFPITVRHCSTDITLSHNFPSAIFLPCQLFHEWKKRPENGGPNSSGCVARFLRRSFGSWESVACVTWEMSTRNMGSSAINDDPLVMTNIAVENGPSQNSELSHQRLYFSTSMLNYQTIPFGDGLWHLVKTV